MQEIDNTPQRNGIRNVLSKNLNSNEISDLNSGNLSLASLVSGSSFTFTDQKRYRIYIIANNNNGLWMDNTNYFVYKDDDWELMIRDYGILNLYVITSGELGTLGRRITIQGLQYLIEMTFGTGIMTIQAGMQHTLMEKRVFPFQPNITKLKTMKYIYKLSKRQPRTLYRQYPPKCVNEKFVINSISTSLQR